MSIDAFPAPRTSIVTAARPGPASETVAFMDIGTNSIRQMVVQINPNHSVNVMMQLKEMVRLGEGEFIDGTLQPDAIDRVVNVAKQFAVAARAAGASQTIAAATAATREASNQRVLLTRLREEAGIDVHVVSGLEEARLVYLGVSHGVHLEDKQAMFIDIGGGSTEFAIGGQDEHSYLNSLKLGAIRLATHFTANMDGPISPRLYEKMRAEVRRTAARTLHELHGYRIDLAIGSSGTIENLADVAARMFLKRPRENDDVLQYSQLREVVAYLGSLTLEKRRLVPGLNPGRAEIVMAGAAILDTAMEDLGITEIRASDRGLRDGLLVDYLVRNEHGQMFEGLSVRERSVLHLGRICGFNEAHARTTARLALALFDSSKESGLHTLGEKERELLEYAALLHHIGSFLNQSGYQNHSYYLIHNADLLGFDQEEIEVIATTALHHRKATPRKRNHQFAMLSQWAQEAVRVLSTLLRIAENLDRSQAMNVRDARLTTRGSGQAMLSLYPNADCQVEIWGVENQKEAFKRVFGRNLSITTTEVI